VLDVILARIQSAVRPGPRTSRRFHLGESRPALDTMAAEAARAPGDAPAMGVAHA
jgi:hypothetical protein